MAQLNTYLTFNGNCEEAFNFYKSVFNSEFESMSKFKDMPENPEFSIAEADKEKIMHVALPISKDATLMGSDTDQASSAKFIQGNNFSMSIGAESKEEADRLFDELSKSGQVMMPMQNTFWDSYFGMLTDQFGINWMISFDD